MYQYCKNVYENINIVKVICEPFCNLKRLKIYRVIFSAIKYSLLHYIIINPSNQINVELLKQIKISKDIPLSVSTSIFETVNLYFFIASFTVLLKSTKDKNHTTHIQSTLFT